MRDFATERQKERDRKARLERRLDENAKRSEDGKKETMRTEIGNSDLADCDPREPVVSIWLS